MGGGVSGGKCYGTRSQHVSGDKLTSRVWPQLAATPVKAEHLLQDQCKPWNTAQNLENIKNSRKRKVELLERGLGNLRGVKYIMCRIGLVWEAGCVQAWTRKGAGEDAERM